MESRPKRRKEPFPGAYFLGLALTILALYLVLLVTSALPPFWAGAVGAFLLGLTANPRYAVIFLIIGLASILLGYLAKEPMVAGGGLGLSLAELALLLISRRKA